MATTSWSQSAGMTSDTDADNVTDDLTPTDTSYTQRSGMISDTDVDNVEDFAEQAEASKDAAAASAAAAALSETAAETAETNAETAETNVAASAATATTKASEASTSAATATTKASEASTSASNAATSATAAQTAQTAAETAQTAAETAQTASETAQTGAETAQAAAEAAQDAIDGLYLGAQASDPSVDGLGAALTAGDWYYNTTDNIVRIYDGSAWVDGSVETSSLATAAQGALADTAVQPNDSPSFGSITVTGTVDGRDIAADGTKLDGIEASADVTDTASVTASGALMDSEVVNLAQVKAFDSSDYATAAQGTLADSAVQLNDSPTFGAVTATSYAGDGSALTGLPAGYTNADVDAHLNYSTATSGQVLSYSGSDYDWVDASAGGGMFKGENGTVGTRAGDIFRINEQTLNTSTTIDADENASATGPLAVATGVTLTVTTGGSLSIV